MKKKAIEDLYPLTPMQQGMLFHSLYDPHSGVYFEQVNCALHGDLDVTAFDLAWQRVVERHPVLRTGFQWQQRDEPFQVVYRRARLPLEQHDWRDAPPEEQAERLAAYEQADRSRGFDLSHTPLMRLAHRSFAISHTGDPGVTVMTSDVITSAAVNMCFLHFVTRAEPMATSVAADCGVAECRKSGTAANAATIRGRWCGHLN